ncbi:hypothetical protein P3342_000906 [Pyrenophora teres f. teres]|uniref:Uncharacterized protein n=2 Tax=Pyrenophora teres f. teres TaxID=97479 RepID=E3RQB8_PYRTT|nr:hypothetical protein PTT_10898 [Pyrenophora teres f. teres 0-1]KAE8835995.1 hypothetical protein HRS9139_04093 [Pyrenophora teres f. teres]CAA9957160.1 hypothetical protein PTMSG1_00768 [Pyrenophora teres f. maculata]KAE8838033.1 hypothetical protein PTNB85_05368 [Pyrenophora teres f. teres]KAE8839546.1 hypothetical protein HRS9122_06151 [Pyrenophora teres f. teres]
MPSLANPFVRPATTSPRLHILQVSQLSIAALSLVAFVITLVLPLNHKLFTLSLLYTPLLTSITTVYLVRREKGRLADGTLSKQKYVKYQLFKMAAAIGLSVVGFIGHLASAPHGAGQGQKTGERGTWINGVRINTWMGLMLWINFFNWLFLWASLCYSCCMTGNKQGSIALAGEEARIGLADETYEDENQDARV